MNHNMPIPLNDELALGLLGRFARLNGMSSTAWAINAIKSTFQEMENEPKLWLIAKACAVDTSKFSSKHSMLPVMYPISRYVGTEREAGNKHHLAHVSGLSTSMTGLRWCPKCARGDHMNQGFSYWRRQHHINGIDWCEIHRIPLCESGPDSGISAPGRRSTQHRHARPNEDVETELDHPALQRVQYIQLAWLQCFQPVNIKAWSEVVGQRCRALQLRVGEIGKRAVASDLILEQLPITWLRRYFPEIADKRPHAFVRKVDGACIDRHVTYPALACAAILAVLFENAEQAVAELNLTNQRLTKATGSQDPTHHALTAFFNGAGLREACERFGADIQSVEAHLRNCHLPSNILETA